MFNDFDEYPQSEAMDRIIEMEMDAEIERKMDLKADETDEKITRF
jgi:hypothetical protein